jgi:hypothetical protein
MARDHKALENPSDLRDQLDTEAARRNETEALDEFLYQIALECDQYCAALVLELSSTFSEQIARGNRAGATPRGDERS